MCVGGGGMCVTMCARARVCACACMRVCVRVRVSVCVPIPSLCVKYRISQSTADVRSAAQRVNKHSNSDNVFASAG